MTDPNVLRALKDRWRDIRDAQCNKPVAVACIDFAYDAGLISPQEHELWIASLASCQGHDDEGGRHWCAYCGEMEQER